MTEILRETHTLERNDGAIARTNKTGAGILAIERIIYLIAGIITGLLALRFVFALLGANPSNPFANFIYSASHPLVSPFFGLFNYRSQYGESRFELDTLIAIVVYALFAWLIVKIVAVVTNTDEVDA